MLDVRAFAGLIEAVLRGTPFPHRARALALLLGTAAQESALTYTTQLGGGPAKGYFQCEPATETDIWVHFLGYNDALGACFAERCGMTAPNVTALEYNMVYQILLCRTHYYRCDPDALPQVDDVAGQAHRWKRYYNTPAGAGTEAEYVANYAQLIAPYWPVARGRA
jgi:hypothetical protein